jgi:serine/threonine protein kinase
MTPAEPAQNLESIVIDSSRYEIKYPIGRGCWGAVYSAYDHILEEEVAIKILDPSDVAKEQMKHRNLDAFKAMTKEGGKLRACANVVPRTFELDNRGIPFIVMEKYKEFLSDFLRDDGERFTIDLNDPTKVDIGARILSSIANGISEIHDKLHRVHGDLKPDNIALGFGYNALVNDLGASTCASFGMSESPRDNIGFLYTRAPECFDEESRPSKKSDVWAFGSLMYRMFTGKYVFEDELNKVEDPIGFMTGLDAKVGQSMIDEKIEKNIPRKLRKFMKRCLAFDERRRLPPYRDWLKDEFESAMDNFNTYKRVKTQLRKMLTPVILPLTLALAIAANFHKCGFTKTEYETKWIEQKEVLYAGHSLEEAPLKFDREFIKDLPTKHPSGCMTKLPPNMYATKTGSQYAKYLAERLHITLLAEPGFYAYSNKQFYQDYLESFTSEEQRKEAEMNRNVADILIFFIDSAIKESKKDNGKIDLEDVCVITRVGKPTLLAAKAFARSEDFKDYISVKYGDGSYVIPEGEQRVIKTWLSYVH